MFKVTSDFRMLRCTIEFDSNEFAVLLNFCTCLARGKPSLKHLLHAMRIQRKHGRIVLKTVVAALTK